MLSDTKGTYYIRALSKNHPSKRLFFAYVDTAIQRGIYFVRTVAKTEEEFVEMLGREVSGEADMQREELFGWLDRMDVELFTVFPRNVRDGRDGSGV